MVGVFIPNLRKIDLNIIVSLAVCEDAFLPKEKRFREGILAKERWRASDAATLAYYFYESVHYCRAVLEMSCVNALSYTLDIYASARTRPRDIVPTMTTYCLLFDRKILRLPKFCSRLSTFIIALSERSSNLLPTTVRLRHRKIFTTWRKKHDGALNTNAKSIISKYLHLIVWIFFLYFTYGLRVVLCV